MLEFFLDLDCITLTYSRRLPCSISEVYKGWQQVGQSRDKQAWEMTPATVNAYYSPPANEASLEHPFISRVVCTYRVYTDCLPSWHLASSILFSGVVRLFSIANHLLVVIHYP